MVRTSASAIGRSEAEAPGRRSADLRTLFHEHYVSVWRLLRRLGVPSSAVDDAAQEVFWVAARRLEDIMPGSEQAFLYGVSLRVASNHRRRAASEPSWSGPEPLSLVADEGLSPEQHLDQSRARELLDVALAQLREELRTAFVLFELEGLELQQIAELLGIPLGTVSSRLRRAREEFATVAKRLRARLHYRQGGS